MQSDIKTPRFSTGREGNDHMMPNTTSQYILIWMVLIIHCILIAFGVWIQLRSESGISPGISPLSSLTVRYDRVILRRDILVEWILESIPPPLQISRKISAAKAQCEAYECSKYFRCRLKRKAGNTRSIPIANAETSAATCYQQKCMHPSTWGY